MRSHTVSEERHPNPSADVEGSVHRPPQLVHAPFIGDASAFQWVGAHQGVAPWQRRRTRRRNRTACKLRIAKRPNIGFGRLFFLLSQAIRRASPRSTLNANEVAPLVALATSLGSQRSVSLPPS